MSILSAIGLGKTVRYAVVALGDIAQEAFLPGVAHTGNSAVTAFVTGDPEKARVLGKRHGVTDIYDYGQFDTLLKSGKIDAIYLATPNWRHAEFAIPALQAGIHVLAEKPLEISVAKCREIVEARNASKAKLMTAYRLHFEPATLDLIDKIRAGTLGDVHLFSSVFTLKLDPENHRARHGDEAGPVFDLGPYPINAARYVFEAEPTEVISATGTRDPQSGLGDFSHTVAATLRFPGDRIAQFIVSYVLNPLDTLHAVGTKGSVQLSPAYMFGKSLEQHLAIGENKSHASFKNTDQFGGELKYFSDCILEDRDPEPDGEEGLADVRVIEGIIQAIKTGRSVQLPPFTRTKRIDTKAQLQTLRAKSSPEPVNASNPAKGVDHGPGN